MVGRKEEMVKKLASSLRPNSIGLAVIAIGIFFIFFAAQIRDFTQTDINFSIFGGVLVILGLLLWIRRGKGRRRY